MKIRVQWKDPDYVNAKTGEWVTHTVDEEGKDYETLISLGMAEYLVVEFDTEAKTATVVPRRSL